MGSPSFKVIIAGGGPVGLTAAHALWRAGVDFVLLERAESVIIDSGPDQVLLPIGLRVLGQLGLLDSLRNVSSHLTTIGRLDHSGRSMGDIHCFFHEKRCFGAFPRVLSRHDLTRVLYDSLPDVPQNKVLTNKEVSSISSTQEGVSVSCADGSSYAGSLVIGADGAESTVNDEQPFLATYRCLWMRFPTNISPGLYPGFASETHGQDVATQSFSGKGTTMTRVYERMKKPTRKYTKYSQSDQDTFIERWGHLPLTANDKLTLRDAYENRIEAGLLSLEEGVVRNWSWSSRVVLAGDAAHAFTPSTAAGCNNGILDIVALANELHAALRDARAEAGTRDVVPTADRLEAAFRAYQETRRDAVVEICEDASNTTSLATWGTWAHKSLDRYGLGWGAVQGYFVKQATSVAANMPVLEYVAGEERLTGKTPWVNPIPSRVLTSGSSYS
ncbi:3-hydroxybenzoate 6-hydroxylase-like protein [Hapsidospora chrysogenum ATCC 11550]|uniref:3-hydroxybenzoate 6-hydroxylase-like protein n=1 Tax=Hapsidospora chrysogenum (strain ATCC 11550 / CBS 779.69 / DSM 880 / IAM 14645 / JCM 23072 / IMI 49137) TaxID=857340 RepID=A0A086T9T0_HAPC1|nr:3-hydroxybenzoate 6-hydroxylase-like protein [Hapsidospora chrysogenum ATCC 11550]